MQRSMAVLSLSVLALGVAVKRTGAVTATAAASVPAQAPGSRRVWAEGRVVARPGAETHIAPEIGGRVVACSLREKGTVKKGEVVCELASDEHKAALAEAKAKIVEADAAIEHLEVEVARAEKMLRAELLSAQAAAKTKHDLELARARRATAVAAAAHAEVLIGRTKVLAPIDGMVIRLQVQEGETVSAGMKLARIVDLTSVRIEAEIDEFDATSLTVGARATVSAEGHPTKWTGRVEELPDVIVARSLEREGPGEPQGSHVLLAKIGIAEKTPLRLGQRVELDIQLEGDDQGRGEEVVPVAGATTPAGTATPAATAIAAPEAAPAPEASPLPASAFGLGRRAPEPDAGLAATASAALTIAGAGFTAFAIYAFRRKTQRLGARRLVRLGGDGSMLDHDILLERHATGSGKARVALETGGALLLRATGPDGIEATPEGLEVSIEGVIVEGTVALVHGMVIAVATGDQPARYVYLDREASHSEQTRVWVDEESGFLTAEGDSIADVWREDEFYVFDDTNVVDAEVESSSAERSDDA